MFPKSVKSVSLHYASVAVAQFSLLPLGFLKFHTNHSDSQSRAQPAGAFQQEMVWWTKSNILGLSGFHREGGEGWNFPPEVLKLSMDIIVIPSALAI